MTKKSNKKKLDSSTIALNRKARHEYIIEKTFEAGIALQGWEVKSIRQGKVQIAEAYILLKKGEAFIIGSVIQPLLSASTHVRTEPDRTRKLLLHKKEIDNLVGSVERKGYTVIPLKMYWKKNRVKLEIAVAKGKKSHDKRESDKKRDWEREKASILKRG